MLDDFVCLRDVIQREPFGNIKTFPAGLKRLIDSAHSFHLGLSRYIVTADKEQPGVDKDESPDWDFWRGSIGGVSCDRTALYEYLNVEVDVRGERHFNDVMHAAGSGSLNVFPQLWVCQKDLVRTGKGSSFESPYPGVDLDLPSLADLPAALR